MKEKIRIRNVGWIASAVALIALLAVANAKGMVSAALCMLVVCIVGMIVPDMHQYMAAKSKRKSLLTLLITALSGVNFYVMWQPSSLVARIAQQLGMTKNVFLAIIAILGATVAYYAVRCVIGACGAIGIRLREDAAKSISLYDAGHKIGKKEYAFLLAVAAVTMTICSKSSPIYPFNDWVDSNCFFTVGKSMLHGKVLYQDIYEQKGFYLYVLHAIAYLISHTTFFGVYLLEIVAAFAFLVSAYKIALLYVSDTNVLYATPVLAAIVYGAQAFCHGDSAEEFCLPLLAYALWVGLKAMQHGSLPERKEYFLIGITSGIVLWIKYTMLGFYLGWYAVIAYSMFRAHRCDQLMSSLKWIAVGVLAASLPVLLYFAGNRALKDLWQAYFINNMFLYSDSINVEREYGALGNIVNGVWLAVIRDGLLCMLLLLTVLWHGAVSDKKTVALLFSCMLGAMIVFVGDTSHIYYALIFCVFAAAALPATYCLCWSSFLDKRILGMGGVILALVLSNNLYMLQYKKPDLPQYAFKKIIDRVEQPSLLNYGFLDGGFYTICDIVPDCKYFCKLNIELADMNEMQDNYLENGMSDFIVTRDKVIECELYERVAEQEFEFENKLRKYTLYALKELNLQ